MKVFVDAKMKSCKFQKSTRGDIFFCLNLKPRNTATPSQMISAPATEAQH